MQRVAIITPFSNLAVEEEFQKYINNPQLIYQIFKLDYSTHKCDNEEKFYLELKDSLEKLVDKLTFVKFDMTINMCSSLNTKVVDKPFEDSNMILKEYIKNRQPSISLFISPYSENVTNDIAVFLEINPSVEYIDLKHSCDYYEFSNTSLKQKLQIYSGPTLISCTNILTLDLIIRYKSDIISTNYAVVEYLNKLR